MLSLRLLLGKAGLGGDMGAVIKSMQLGIILSSGNNVITEVDPAKTVLILGGRTCYDQADLNIRSGVRLTSSTVVLFDGPDADVAACSVIEFESGVSVQRGYSTVPTGETIQDYTIDEVDPDRTMVSYLGGDGYSGYPNSFPWAFILNSTTLRLQKAAAYGQGVLSWEAIEFE